MKGTTPRALELSPKIIRVDIAPVRLAGERQRWPSIFSRVHGRLGVRDKAREGGGGVSREKKVVVMNGAKMMAVLAALALSTGCELDDRQPSLSGEGFADAEAPAPSEAASMGGGGAASAPSDGPNGMEAALGCSPALGECRVCEPDSARCSEAGDVERCDAAGSGWVFSATCSGETPECVPETGTCGACSAGDVRSCVGALGNCAAGAQSCGSDLRWGPCSIQPALVDSCSPGDDADCDGTPNNPPEGCNCSADVSCGISDVGSCQLGTSRCTDGRLGACVGALTPAPRDCRSIVDNDCDGLPDSQLDAVCQCSPGSVEACDAHVGLDGIGICRAGQRTCVASAGALSSNWGACLGSLGPAAKNCTSTADNDCNGLADREEPVCTPEVTVTIESRGNATFGFVSSSPAGLACSNPPCRASFPAGTSITLESQTVSQFRHGFSGWGGPCSGLEECSFIASANVTVTAAFDPANVVFVTSATTTGDLGGRQGADALCNRLAAAGSQPGQYFAWLSTSTDSAVDRMRGARGWIRPDGLPVVDTLDDFTGDMFHPIRIDEARRDVGTLSVLTASTGAGRLGPPGGVPCADFTSGLPGGTVVDGGNTNAIGFRFSSFNQAACSVPRPIYCFGVDREVAIRPRADDGRVAFVSRGFLPAGGRAGADQFCRSEAGQLGLSGSFKALLATSTASPASQFDLTGPPWIGLDGVRIASTARAFFEAAQWDTAPKPDGAQGNGGVRVGGTTLTQAGTLQNTCNDWTSTAGSADVGSVGMVNVRDFFHFFGASACDSGTPIVCMEE
jgi:hypothetical protein